MSKDDIVIVAAKRTAIGSFQGKLSNIPAPVLGAETIKDILKNTKISPDDIDETIIGCVLPAGMGQAPARQVSILSDIPNKVGATTINKMCGSGMKSTMIAYDSIKAGSNNIVISGGIENMSRAPYILPKVRDGLRMGHGKIQDHMFLDGLEDAYEPGKLMGSFAEDTAEYYQFTRDQQDNFSITSLERARKANKDGLFAEEIVPLKIINKKKEIIFKEDEQPFVSDISKIPNLRPAFKKDGTVTAANSSSISDGASSLLLMKQSDAEKRNLTPLAKIIGHSTNSHEPSWFTTAPIGAIKKLLEKINWASKEVDLYEINEAFAVVPMAAMRDLSISHDILNINGGACALGHPVGASGARIITTLIYAMKRNNLNKGIASLCIGGGEATAMAIEMIN